MTHPGVLTMGHSLATEPNTSVRRGVGMVLSMNEIIETSEEGSLTSIPYPHSHSK
jgi:hypothetical protein